MKDRAWFLVVAVGVAAPAAAAPQSASTVGADTVIVDINAGMTMMYDRLRSIVIALAQKMPAEQWDFRPTSEVRTFAAAVGHAVTTNINVCGNLVGRRHALAGRHLDQTMTRKDELLPALESSFVFCDEYVRGLAKGQLSDSMFTTSSTRQGHRRFARVAHGTLLTNLIAHNAEMYGYLAVYLRLKGLVPPSSEPPPARPAGEAGGFAVLLGSDTVQVERFERAGNTVRGASRHSPRLISTP